MPDRTVSTVEEIEALPDDAIVYDRSGYAWQKISDWRRVGETIAVTGKILAKRYAPLTVLVPEQQDTNHG